MFIIVTISIISVDGNTGALSPGNGDLLMRWVLTLMFVLDMSVEGRIAEIAFPTRAHKVTFVGVIPGPSFPLHIDLSTFKHLLPRICYNTLIN